MPKILSSRVTWDTDGINYIMTHVLGPTLTDEEIHDYFPATRCHHSHDCCGKHYARRAQIERFPDHIEVTQRHACNI